jgi:hypothetical protein
MRAAENTPLTLMCVELLGGTAELDVADGADEVPVLGVAGVAGPY